MYNDILTKDINTENRKLRQNLYEMTQMYNQCKDELNSVVSLPNRDKVDRSRPSSRSKKVDKQERDAFDKEKEK